MNIKKKNFIFCLIGMFVFACLLSCGIYAYANSVKFKMSIQLSPTVFFALSVKINAGAEQFVFDNQPTPTHNIEDWASVDGLTIALNNEDIASAESVELIVYNYNPGQFMSLAVVDNYGGVIETDPAGGLKNIASGSYDSMFITNHAIANKVYIFKILAEKYTEEIETVEVVGTTSSAPAYKNFDYVTHLTTETPNRYVDITKLTVGGTLLEENVDYSYEITTGKLTIPADKVTGAINVETLEKPKTITATLILDGCTARRNGIGYSSGETVKISNLSSIDNLVFSLYGNNGTHRAWVFDIYQYDMTQITNYDWRINGTNKTLTVPAKALVSDVVIKVNLGAAWDGSIGTAFASGSGTQVSPYQIANEAQMAYLAQSTNAGTTYSGNYFELQNDLYLNDELFIFEEETGLVRVQDTYNNNTLYMGTGLAPTLSKYTILDSTGVQAADNLTTAGTYYIKDGNTFAVAVEGTHYTLTELTTTAVGRVSYKTTGATWSTLNCWESIGNKNRDTNVLYAFSGGFDGCGKDISAIFVAYNHYMGIFGYINGVGVFNINALHGCVCNTNEGEAQTGGVVGSLNSSASIKNCSNKNIVQGRGRLGGVIGNTWDSGIVANCVNFGPLITNSSCGGVCGYNFGRVFNSFNVGNVYTENWVVGGIVGRGGRTDIDNHSFVNNCYNVGNVKGHGVGGVVGASYTTNVENCYNFGQVLNSKTLIYNEDYAGGIVGCNGVEESYYSYCSVNNCYNFNLVERKKDGVHGGGIVGRNRGTVLNSKYLSTSCAVGVGVNAAGTSTNVTAFNLDKAKGLFASAGVVVNGQTCSTLTQALNAGVDMLKAQYPDYTFNYWQDDTLGINGGYPVFSNSTT